MSLEGFPTELDADVVTGPLLDEYATPSRVSRCVLTSESPYTPYVDFGLGDIVSASAFGEDGWETVPMRVVSISGQLQELSIIWTVELVD